MTTESKDRITAEAEQIRDAARQIVALQAAATPDAAPPASLAKIEARLESVRFIMTAVVEDLAAAAAQSEG